MCYTCCKNNCKKSSARKLLLDVTLVLRIYTRSLMGLWLCGADQRVVRDTPWLCPFTQVHLWMNKDWQSETSGVFLYFDIIFSDFQLNFTLHDIIFMTSAFKMYNLDNLFPSVNGTKTKSIYLNLLTPFLSLFNFQYKIYTDHSHDHILFSPPVFRSG